jgi:hypothetical protein
MVYQNMYKYLYSHVKRRGQIENKSSALCVSHENVYTKRKPI